MEGKADDDKEEEDFIMGNMSQLFDVRKWSLKIAILFFLVKILMRYLTSSRIITLNVGLQRARFKFLSLTVLIFYWSVDGSFGTC